MDEIITTKYQSPCGTLLLGTYGSRLCMCDWPDSGRHHSIVTERLRRTTGADFREGSSVVIEEAMRQLDEYFAGKRKTFALELYQPGTEFQRQVWALLRTLSYGAVVSYGALARQIGRAGTERALAAAVGANALSIVVPCHRVIGSDGRLTGYAGGLEAKSRLLVLERGGSLML